MSDDTHIRVFSLNCWGLKYVSKDRHERIAAISNFLSRSDYDIVALQELWVYSDYETVRTSVAKHLPYAKFFYSGALGAGLAIFTRFPIIGAMIHSYSLNGSPLDVKAGDWFVGKAATSVLVTHPVLGQVQIFNTHLFAKGGEGGPEHHRAHRLVNAWEFAKQVKQAAEIGRYIIAAGDFNSIPTTLPMTVIRDHAALSDAWASTHSSPSLSTTPGTLNFTPHEAIATFGVTADSPLNSYSAGKPLDVYARAAQGKRLDYILFRDPLVPPSLAGTFKSNAMPSLVCTDSRVLLTEPIPGLGVSFSDHFGLEATFAIRHPESQLGTLPAEVPSAPTAEHAGQSMPSLSTASEPATTATAATPTLSVAHATAMLQALTGCYRHSHTRQQRELLVFALCVALLVALVAGTAWLPSAAYTPLFVFAGAGATWLGTTMLYVGFVYGRWELNALMNVIEELELYRRGLDGTLGAGSESYFVPRE
ncbi:inositol phosphophingolipids phospholipase C [Dentipellis sp. KUC8613]|nr:inositol phosphophingolipids phospholipase C [Dentipellis sp. KUC8613]